MTLLAQLKTSPPFLNAKTMDEINKRENFSKSSIDLRTQNTDKPQHKSLSTPGTPVKSNFKEPTATQSASTRPKDAASANSPAKNKFFQIGESLKSKLHTLASPKKSKSMPNTPTKGSAATRGRRMSTTSTSSGTPSIQINDSVVNLGDNLNNGVQARLTRSARPGRLPSAVSLKRRKRKKRRTKSEAVLQEKKKDKWAEYALQFADDIEIEDGVEPSDKWDKYVKNYIKESDNTFMKNAEKKMEIKKEPVKINYSSDESEDDENNKQKEINFQKRVNIDQAIPEEERKDNESDVDISEDENDNRKRLLENMEKIESNEKLVVPSLTPSTKPPTGAPEKSYHNGPAVDFKEQIRKISQFTPQTIDMSQLIIPNKQENIKEEEPQQRQGNKLNIHSAIDDILNKEEENKTQQKSKAIRRPERDSNQKKAGKTNNENQEKDLKELEDSIMENHETTKQHETNRKVSEIDELISELKLTV